MTQPISRGALLIFAEAVARDLAAVTDLYVIGGAALLLAGAARSTLDLDVVGQDLTDRQSPDERALLAIAHAHNIDLELVPMAGFVPPLGGADARHRLLLEAGSLKVWMYDPVAISLGKLDRAFLTDLADVAFMLKSGLVMREQIHAALDEVRPVASRYEFDVTAMRRRLDRLVPGPVDIP